MASARHAAARTRASAASRAPRSRPTLVRGHGARAIRWDRVGRVVLLLVLLGVMALYVGPSISFVQTWERARAHRAEVSHLRQENQRLRARRTALQSSRTLEREARRLGLVKPGERPYVVQDLPRD